MRTLPGVIEILEYHVMGDMLEVEDKEEFGVDLLLRGLNDKSHESTYHRIIARAKLISPTLWKHAPLASIIAARSRITF